MTIKRPKRVAVTATFDEYHPGGIRFLHECSKLGQLHVLLWSDEAVHSITGKYPEHPVAERLSMLQAIRYVADVQVVATGLHRNVLPRMATFNPDIWAVDEANHSPGKQAFCRALSLEYRVIPERDIKKLPAAALMASTSGRKKVVISGSFDRLHSGHVRFFEQVSRLGDLYAVVGSDRNVALLKGDGHPTFNQEERRYMVGSMHTVRQALVSTGRGWLDAKPEIDAVKPDLYVVSEDGDRPERHRFCEQRGLEYVVLQRRPQTGLAAGSAAASRTL
jgi:cytidyltransferase-like protein